MAIEADRPSEPDHGRNTCSTRLVMVTQKAAGSVTEPAFPLARSTARPTKQLAAMVAGRAEVK